MYHCIHYYLFIFLELKRSAMKLINYILVALIFFVVDLPWLALGSKYSKSMIESIQHSPLTVRYLPSIIVYVALSYLITLPQNSYEAFYLGSATYAIYDFTNLATLNNYSKWFAISDTLWGGALFVIVYIIVKWLKLN